MTTKTKAILGAVALALALPSGAVAQQAQPPATEEAQPPILPRKPAAAAGQPNEARQSDRHARGGHHDDRGVFFFGRHGSRDRDCDKRGSARTTQQPAAPGTVAPPANGLFNNGAAPKAQTN